MTRHRATEGAVDASSTRERARVDRDGHGLGGDVVDVSVRPKQRRVAVGAVTTPTVGAHQRRRERASRRPSAPTQVDR